MPIKYYLHPNPLASNPNDQMAHILPTQSSTSTILCSNLQWLRIL